MKSIILLFFLIVFSNCTTPPPHQQSNDADSPHSTLLYGDTNSAKPVASTVTTNQTHFEKELKAGNLTFNVTCDNSESSTIHVVCTGLKNKDKILDYPIEGQLRDAFVLDLDKNSFSELYLIIKQTGDSGNLTIIGISSYRDKSIGDIYVPEMAMKRRVNSDQVYIEDEKLFRKMIDENGIPKIFSYHLKQGEASFVLEAEQVE